MSKLCRCQPLLKNHFLSGVCRPLNSLFPMKSRAAQFSRAPKRAEVWTIASMSVWEENKQTKHISRHLSSVTQALCFFFSCFALQKIFVFFPPWLINFSPPSSFLFYFFFSQRAEMATRCGLSVSLSSAVTELQVWNERYTVCLHSQNLICQRWRS